MCLQVPVPSPKGPAGSGRSKDKDASAVKAVGARQPDGPKRTPFKTPQSSATKKVCVCLVGNYS